LISIEVLQLKVVELILSRGKQSTQPNSARSAAALIPCLGVELAVAQQLTAQRRHSASRKTMLLPVVNAPNGVINAQSALLDKVALNVKKAIGSWVNSASRNCGELMEIVEI